LKDKSKEYLTRSEILNMMNLMFTAEEEKRRSVGCNTLIGCHKGKEIENILRGPLLSKVEDLRIFRVALEKEFPILKEEVKHMTDNVKNMLEESRETRKIFRGLLISILMLFVGFLATQIFTIKTNIDAKNADVSTQLHNQERMEAKLLMLLNTLEAQIEEKSRQKMRSLK